MDERSCICFLSLIRVCLLLLDPRNPVVDRGVAVEAEVVEGGGMSAYSVLRPCVTRFYFSEAEAETGNAAIVARNDEATVETKGGAQAG